MLPRSFTQLSSFRSFAFAAVVGLTLLSTTPPGWVWFCVWVGVADGPLKPPSAAKTGAEAIMAMAAIAANLFIVYLLFVSSHAPLNRVDLNEFLSGKFKFST